MPNAVKELLSILILSKQRVKLYRNFYRRFIVFLLFFHPLSTLSMYNMQSTMRRISNLGNKIFRR